MNTSAQILNDSIDFLDELEVQIGVAHDMCRDQITKTHLASIIGLMHAHIGLHSEFNCIPNDKLDSCTFCNTPSSKKQTLNTPWKNESLNYKKHRGEYQ